MAFRISSREALQVIPEARIGDAHAGGVVDVNVVARHAREHAEFTLIQVVDVLRPADAAAAVPRAITARRPSAVPPLKRSIIGVSTIPGHTALMRMFCEA